jgi:hypothetical protein
MAAYAPLTVGAIALLTLGVSAQIPSQAPPPAPPASTGVVVGQVVDGTSSRPVAGALVALTPAPGGIAGINPGEPMPMDQFMSLDIGALMSGVRQTLTDNQGRFAFTSLPRSTFTLNATKAGWSGGGYGQQRPDGTPAALILIGNDRVGDVSLRLWKNAAIVGTVVDEAGDPIVGLSVRAVRRTWQAGRARLTVGGSGQTDDRGMYRIGGLRPGEYLALVPQTPATAPVSGAPGGLDPAVLQAMIASGGAGTDPNALIANITALSAGGSSNGIRVGPWVLQTSTMGGRLIPPGTSGGRMVAYRTTFYPSALSSSQATAISLGSGDERTGVDFQLRPGVVEAVSGTLTGPDGPIGGLQVRLVPTGSEEMGSDAGFESATSTSAPDGTFAFLAVPPGQYVLKALRTPRLQVGSAGLGALGAGASVIQNAQGGRAVSMGPMTMDMIMPAPAPIPTEATLWASVPVSVGESDIAGFNVALRPGYRVSGRAEFDGGSPKPTGEQLRRMPVVLDRADIGGAQTNPLAGMGQTSGGQFDATGQFTTYGLLPGKYFIRAPFSFGNWTLKSATLGGRDVSDSPFEIDSADVSGVVLTFTDRPPELSGVVRDGQSKPSPSASVVVFPAQPEEWVDFGSAPRRLRATKTGPDGRYRLAGLPAGDYYVAAVAGEVASDWQNASALQDLVRLASRVTIGDAEKKAQDLTVGR